MKWLEFLLAVNADFRTDFTTNEISVVDVSASDQWLSIRLIASSELSKDENRVTDKKKKKNEWKKKRKPLNEQKDIWFIAHNWLYLSIEMFGFENCSRRRHNGFN